MSRETEITERFYDQETGDLIELEDGVVVNVHKSILPKQERLTINRERAQRLVTQQVSNQEQEPLVQPKMFKETKQEIILQKPKQEPATEQESGYVAPVMEW